MMCVPLKWLYSYTNYSLSTHIIELLAINYNIAGLLYLTHMAYFSAFHDLPAYRDESRYRVYVSMALFKVRTPHDDYSIFAITSHWQKQLK